MINVKELMRGNYLIVGKNTDWEEVCIINEIYADVVALQGREFSTFVTSLDPIPITDDFLIKNGFEKQCIFESIIEGYEGIYEWEKEVDGYFVSFRQCANHKDCDWCVHIDNADRDSIALVDIQYVHQLQNVMNVLGIKLNLIIE